MRASATANLDRLCHQVVQQSRPKKKKKRKRDTKGKAGRDGAGVAEEDDDDPDEATDDEDNDPQDSPATSSASAALHPATATQTPHLPSSPSTNTATSSRPARPPRDYADEDIRKRAADHLVALADTLRSHPSRGVTQHPPPPPPPQQQQPQESPGDLLMQMADVLARSPIPSNPNASDFLRELAEAAKRSEQPQLQSQPSPSATKTVKSSSSPKTNSSLKTANAPISSSFDATVPQFREALGRSINAHAGLGSSTSPENEQSAAEKHAIAVMNAARLKSERAAAARAQDKATRSAFSTPADVQQREQQGRACTITCHYDDGTSVEVDATVAPDGEKIGLDAIEVAMAMADRERQERRKRQGAAGGRQDDDDEDDDDDDDIELVPVITTVGGNIKDIEAFTGGQTGLESRLDIRNYEVVGPSQVKMLRKNDNMDSTSTAGKDDPTSIYESVRNRATSSGASQVEMKKRRQPRPRHEATPEEPKHLMVHVERRRKATAAAKTAAGKGAPPSSQTASTRTSPSRGTAVPKSPKAKVVSKDAPLSHGVAADDPREHLMLDGSYAKAQEYMNPGSHTRTKCRGVALAMMGVPRGGIIPPMELSAQLTVLMAKDIVDGKSRQQGDGSVDFSAGLGGMRARLGKWDSVVDWKALESFTQREDLQEWKQRNGLGGGQQRQTEEGEEELSLGLGDNFFAAIAKPSSYNHWHWTLSGCPSDWRSEAAKAGQPVK